MDRDICPVTPLRQTPAVVRGKHKPPCCEHGEWTVAETNYKRKGDEVALPDRGVQARVGVGQGRPPAPAHPTPHEAVARPLQQPWSRRARVRSAQARMGMLPLRVRGIERVRLHADLTILAKLASALGKDRAAPMAA